MAVVEYRGGFIFAGLVLGVMCAVGGWGCAAVPRGGEERVVVVEKDARADGVVVRVDKRAGEVYIDLTKKDHLRAGMMLEVFDYRTGVRRQGLHVVRPAAGVATLQVMEVGEAYSICRIVRATSKEIAAGDPLAGHDFVKGFVPHVAMGGEFDVDGDGVATMEEQERMAWLMRRWGSVIEAGVTVHTDYLVLGKRPASPSMKDPAPVPVKGDVVDHRTQEQREYDQLLEEARRYAIPVLNMNRALDLIDYHDAGLAQR